MAHNTESIILKFKNRHGDKLDYSRVSYVNLITPVEIGCKIHGYYHQKPEHVLRSKGCKFCVKEELAVRYRKDFSQLQSECFNKFGDWYELVENTYKGYDRKMTIICPLHGQFYKKPNKFLKSNGCVCCQKVPKDVTHVMNKIRNLLKNSLRRKSLNKTNKTLEILGCTHQELKAHLENNNYGFKLNTDNISVDHKIPLCRANTESEILELGNFKNLHLLPDKYNCTVKRDRDWDIENFQSWLKENPNPEDWFHPRGSK